MDPKSEDLKKTPLHALHLAQGAKMGEFAGWSMPLFYPLGVMKEHQHTRTATGVFDISHMVHIDAAGPGAAGFLNQLCPIDAVAIEQGCAKYTFMLTESGGIIDDLIVTRLDEDQFLIVANAGCAEKDLAHMRSVAESHDVQLEVKDRAFVAVQGPKADDNLRAVGLTGLPDRFMTIAEPRAGWQVSRSGYTGEDGFEVSLPPEEASGFVEGLLADTDAKMCGLGSRDSLRLEAGLCLYGQDLTEEISPIEAGLLWAVPKSVREDGTFIGADAFKSHRAEGRTRARVGLRPEGRAPVRAGAKLADADGSDAGFVCSGSFGPTVEGPVAMGYVPMALAKPGSIVMADVRGKQIACQVQKLPFVPHRYKT